MHGPWGGYNAPDGVDPASPGRLVSLTPMFHHTIRASRILAGLLLVVIGIVLALPGVPGPGLVVIFAGLGVLGGEFDWARRLRDWMLTTFHRITGRADGG